MPRIFRSQTRVRIPTHLSVTEATLLDKSTAIPPSKIIFEEALSGRTVSYGEFTSLVKNGAAWLRQALALKPGQVVSVISTSCIDYIISVHSVWWAGGVVSLINDSLSPTEIAYGIQLVKPDYIVVGSSASSKLVKSLSLSSPASSAIKIIGLGETHPQWPSWPKPAVGQGDFPEIEAHSFASGDNRQAPAAIILSSGTTGHPKAVVLSHYNLIAVNYQLRADNPDNWRIDMREVFFPPLSHVYALYVAITGAPWLGYYVCLMPRFELETYCRLLSERKATLARLVPPVAKMLAESPVTRRYTYPALEYFTCSAAPISEKTAGDLRTVFPGVKLCQTYGCTEASGACVQSGTREKDMPLNATGKLITNAEIRFIDSTGNDVSNGAPGEITLRGPHIMMGYLADPKATREHMLDGGWYKTGDIGYLDAQGFLFVSGRIKDIIKSNGFQVSPLELEEILVRHPLVKEAAVHGVWSERNATDLLRAYIVSEKPLAKAGRDTEEAARSVAEFVASQVAGYKQLKGGVVFVDSLPKSPTGKLLRRLLKDIDDTGSIPLQSKL
ncbi:hypothetical protein N7536_011069 [Penicillium majusculum]|uniref:AMP-dependent synthetase/ligase domain-containing protein n=1 Tax=Penicillium solitum TaxID=60172 RepID=A0A1V6QHB4_9EURO|nr:uncharacterized protein PENSOL_c069G08321 [Penicillium solitum]KAJ5688450.1 hypothetical protein N7536_011069 [Penicillium majusculum]OQD88603.1 hypothetical protein PENSOL_c069G08321 [Penicillium solitum]